MSEATFEGYLGAWRDALPQRRLAWLFLDPQERVSCGGLAALQQEWLRALGDIGETQVTAVKLAWWREEMERAARGEARHPLTQGLFADARVRALPVAVWTAALDAALARLSAPPPADFAVQQAAVMPLAEALATQETRVAFGSGADAGKAAQVCALGLLVANLRGLASEVAHARSPLPMNLLARHGLTRDGLLDDSPARRAALRDCTGDLEQALAKAAKMAAPLTLLRSVQLAGDLRSLRAALRADDPWQGLRETRSGLRDVLKTWRAARISRRVSNDRNIDAPT